MSVVDLRKLRDASLRLRKEKDLRIRGPLPQVVPPKNLDVCIVLLEWADMVGRLGEVDRLILEAARRTKSVRGVARALSKGRTAARAYVQKRLRLIAQRARTLLSPSLRASPGSRWAPSFSEREAD